MSNRNLNVEQFMLSDNVIAELMPAKYDRSKLSLHLTNVPNQDVMFNTFMGGQHPEISKKINKLGVRIVTHDWFRDFELIVEDCEESATGLLEIIDAVKHGLGPADQSTYETEWKSLDDSIKLRYIC